MTPTPDLPPPAGIERDGDGRLVGLYFDSTPALVAAKDPPWLIAVDGSDNGLRAVAHAARVASAMQRCTLHLVHVQPWMAKEAAECGLPQRGLAATERARAALDAAGLPWRLHVVMGDPAERIMALAARLHASHVVIGSRGLNTVESLLFGSVAYKVMHLCPVPMLVVP